MVKKRGSLCFGIRETLAWDVENNVYAEAAMRQSDVYVFCVETCKEQDKMNPIDFSQWDFYPVATAQLNEVAGKQKTIGLNAPVNMGVKKCCFAAMRDFLKIEPVYKSAPSFAFAVGNYLVSKDGIVTGAYNSDLIAALEPVGFKAK
jgi:hypothetical protein